MLNTGVFTFDFKFWVKAADGVFFFPRGSILVKVHFYVFKRWLGFLIVLFCFVFFNFSAIRATLKALPKQELISLSMRNATRVFTVTVDMQINNTVNNYQATGKISV